MTKLKYTATLRDEHGDQIYEPIQTDHRRPDDALMIMDPDTMRHAVPTMSPNKYWMVYKGCNSRIHSMNFELNASGEAE